MNNFTARTWMAVVMEQELKRIMATYVKYPPRKVQGYGYTGPLTLSNYEKISIGKGDTAKTRYFYPDADRKLTSALPPAKRSGGAFSEVTMPAASRT
jgi:hypothetical protein